MHLGFVFALLACIACGEQVGISRGRLQSNVAGEGRRPLKTADHLSTSHREGRLDQLKTFTTLLLALHKPAAAFSLSGGVRFRRGSSSGVARRSTPRLCDYENYGPSIMEQYEEYYNKPGGPDVTEPYDWYNVQIDYEPPSSEDELMNYGMYTDPLHPGAADHAQSHMANMYCWLVDGANITGKRVLEVGCGRGGGAKVLQKYFKPAMYVGMDLVEKHVASANKRLANFGPDSSLVFVHGDATKIPFPDNSFDVVVNVESSHCYEPFRSFLTEVRRVLVPDGKFLIEDFRGNDYELSNMHAEIVEVFGTDMDVIDIGKNVQTSLDMNKDYIEERVKRCEAFASRRHCEGYWLYGGRDPTRYWKIQLHK